MLTLTIRHVEGATPEAEAEKLALAWRRLREQLTRLYRTRFPFMAVFEKHPSSGRPHLHILLRGRFIDIRVVRAFMTKRLASPQVWIEHFPDARKAANYVAKYVKKAPEKFGNCKRYWSSADWSLKPKPEAQDDTADPVWWTVHMISPEAVLRMAHTDGVPKSFDGERWTIHGSWVPW